ncbi:unnamed protein product [Withania somnifera]
MNTLMNKLNKKKVVFIMGATGAGKTRLSVDLAIHFSGEIINSDKMQIYKGLHVITNKITEAEKRGVTHYLIDEIEPDVDFTAEDFSNQAIRCIEKISDRELVPIIVGGSNSYIEKLVDDPMFMFKSNYDSCFIWIDVIELSLLYSSVRRRVDHMVHAGLVNEVREIFMPDADYSRGIRRSIGVPEMEKYLREENKLDGEVKENTCKLIRNQRQKIERLREEKMWTLHYVDASDVFRKTEKEDVDDAWKETVLKPCIQIVENFLKNEDDSTTIEPDFV